MMEFLFSSCTSPKKQSLTQSKILYTKHFNHPDLQNTTDMPTQQHSRTHYTPMHNPEYIFGLASQKSLVEGLERGISTSRILLKRSWQGQGQGQGQGEGWSVVCEDEEEKGCQTADTVGRWVQGSLGRVGFGIPKNNCSSQIRKIERMGGKSIGSAMAALSNPTPKPQ